MRIGRRAAVWAVAVILWTPVIPAFVASASGTEGHIWLDCDPGDRAHGGGWQAGGIVCLPGSLEPDALLSFDLIVINRDNEDQTDLRIVMAIHSEDPPTTSDELVAVTINEESFELGDFGTAEFNPFDESYGGRHHVYVGTDAIWVVYRLEPGIVFEGEMVRLPVEVRVGGNPSDLFELHFDAFDMDTGAKSPNGHDVTLVSGAGPPPPPGLDRPIPCISGGDSVTVFEGDEVTFDGTCSEDPDGIIVGYLWDLDLFLDSNVDGDTTNDVDATGAVVRFTWYDDYVTAVLLTVVDNDALEATAIEDVTVLNVAPRTSFEGVFVEFDLTIRVAGEKWHNVNLDVHRNYDPDTGTSDGIVGSLEVERWPGPPRDNPTAGDASLPIRVDVAGGDPLTAVIMYDPYADDGDAIRGDQPVNGQIFGDNPVWLILSFPDGTSCRIHHNFNVIQSLIRDRDTPMLFSEPWIVDLGTLAAAGMPVEFVATAVDPGTDDLTFTWDFGDGTIVSTPYLYDPLRGPDPAFPPGSPYEPYAGGTTPPLSIVDAILHSYAAAGVYTVTLTVGDDDGGFALITFDLTVLDGPLC